MMLDEVDTLRADVRDDISTAAHATHRAFAEKFQYLVDQLEATRHELDGTRAQLEAMRADLARVGAPAPAANRPGAAPAPHQPGPGARPGVPGGVVRHTETVQVTTRQTIVDPHAEDAQRGTVYGGFDRGGRAENDYATPPRIEVQRPRSERHRERERDREESWTEQRLREQLERRRDAAEPVSAERWSSRDDRDDREDDRRGSRAESGRRYADDDDDRRPDLSAGDRWASIRSDDRGRELRMGERRADLRSDGSGGTELRIEDRWAAVRREAERGGFPFEDDRLDEPRSGFPFRDQDRRETPRAISSSPDREDRWSDYESRTDRDRERDRDRDRDRYR
ncbi:hypothetical protein [Catellatospora tritici]|uniref:hypothetical protein n=1 Tax=Catellatospora tritici TaxID=2851566 RepID=UPI001C2CE785|nr:hypothetical protein [Catellatospora tritici]MBV1853448.1 hypothetical protein [Catellatospora tritici]